MTGPQCADVCKAAQENCVVVDTAGALDERKTSTLLRSDGVGHHRAASAQWFLYAHGGSRAV